MIIIISRWETSQMSCELEWRMWRQLKGAFFSNPSDVSFIFVPIISKMSNNKLKQFDTMDEALKESALQNLEAPRVFLEPSGNKKILDIPKGDIILILGNTESDNLKYSKPHEIYMIKSPGKTDLYGINAAAIALARRYN